VGNCRGAKLLNNLVYFIYIFTVACRKIRHDWTLIASQHNSSRNKSFRKWGNCPGFDCLMAA
jgi:hypothetical protein